VKTILLFFASLWLGGCMGMPASVAPVNDFELDKYLGKWYEIARLDHSFERGLDQVTAEYSLRDGGGVHVKNRGFSREKKQWREAEGKAFLVGPSDQGYLKVSFFGPFYGSYVVFELDRDAYQYAFVCGPNTSYLWLLSRTPTVAPEVMSHFIDKADELGFAAEKLIHVNHQ
jgi:apolipoprotein D and lipocalin family protein